MASYHNPVANARLHTGPGGVTFFEPNTLHYQHYKLYSPRTITIKKHTLIKTKYIIY